MFNSGCGTITFMMAARLMTSRPICWTVVIGSNTVAAADVTGQMKDENQARIG